MAQASLNFFSLRSFQLTGIPVQVKGENVTGKHGIGTKIIRAKTQTTPVSDFDVRMSFSCPKHTCSKQLETQ
jgi:hypothetical protein